MARPSGGRRFQVRILFDRMSRKFGQRYWRLWARLGKDADGFSAKKTANLRAKPHAARKAEPRGVTRFLRAKGKVGYPPSLSADSQLANSVMANRGNEIFPDCFDGDGLILVRLEGTCARAAWNESGFGPKGRSIRLPLLYLRDHFAVPLRYKVGEVPMEKARGLMLRRQNGPRQREATQPTHTPGWQDTFRNIGIWHLSLF